ncbi:hypothetical protein A5N15_08890 [Rothia kristinae]|uniref:Uncharacterized protein n=1 Tax=Rothia kristinae TaxID=37923 RepID=A0A657IU21_9MICC|nr:hypothetical protein A5N15_08890 [Rothia kristinae]
MLASRSAPPTSADWAVRAAVRSCSTLVSRADSASRGSSSPTCGRTSSISFSAAARDWASKARAGSLPDLAQLLGGLPVLGVVRAVPVQQVRELLPGVGVHGPTLGRGGLSRS